MTGDRRPMADAPLDGSSVILLLADALGEYESHSPKFWDGQFWSDAEYGTPLNQSIRIVGWRPLREGERT